MNDEKQEFLNIIVNTLLKHPDWFGDIVNAMQFGLTTRLELEREKTANLAYALVTFVTEDKKKKFKYYHNIQKGLVTLAGFFYTAPVIKDILPLIEKEKSDGQQ
jgi:hypothetical protein